MSSNINPIAEIEQKTPAAEPDYSARRDPEEEFFMLSVLALKMEHTEEDAAEYIYEVSA